MTPPHGITLALRRDDYAEVWRIDATRDGETRALCERALSHSDPLYRATKAAIGGCFRLDDDGAYWLNRETAERAMAAAQEVLDTPAGTESNGDEIACPWCGHKRGDLWDYKWDGRECIEVECHNCERPFTLARIVSVTYTATPLPAKDGAP
jgi:hypothetical protein